MVEQLACPSCSAPLPPDLIKAGERVGVCPYCGATIELPDDRKDKMKAVFDALAESKLLSGSAATSSHATVQTKVSVVELTEEQKAALKDKFGKAFHIKGPVSSTKVTITTQGGEIPPQMKEMLAQMGINLPGLTAAADESKKSDPEKPEKPPAKKSLWQRLRGK